MPKIPELTHGCNSWIIVEKSTGKVILETFRRKTAEAINQEKYEVRTAADHLKSLNNQP